MAKEISVGPEKKTFVMMERPKPNLTEFEKNVYYFNLLS